METSYRGHSLALLQNLLSAVQFHAKSNLVYLCFTLVYRQLCAKYFTA